MSNAVLLEGQGALDAILQNLAPKLVESWPGDETLVGIIVEVRGNASISWEEREEVVRNIQARGATEGDGRRRQRYEAAVAALSAPRASGKVSLVIAGWGDMITVEIEAEDLQAGKSITSWNGGTA